MSAFRFEILGAQHDRAAFSFGSPPLDDYLKTRARQDARRLAPAIFVMVRNDAPAVVAGYYTLSATSVALSDVPEEFARKLPRYPFAPATLLGRLARDVRFPGTGKLLLVDALQRTHRQVGEIASATVIVDAKDDHAREFYESFGFRPLLVVPPDADDRDVGVSGRSRITLRRLAVSTFAAKACPEGTSARSVALQPRPSGAVPQPTCASTP